MTENIKEELLARFNKTEANIGIIGLGYVGLPLSITFGEAGFKVIGFDIDSKKVKLINTGRSYFKHISNERIIELNKLNRFVATSNFSLSSSVDALIICVPTPLNKYNEPDLSFIRDTMLSIKPFLKKGQIISLESTSYPGTTEEEISPVIKNLGFDIGKNFFIVYSPEREDPGNANFSTKDIPKVIGGITKSCLEVGLKLYEKPIKSLVSVRDTKTAEMTKLLENIHRSVNIGLVNELKPLAIKMGIDIYEVIRAAKTKPFGYTAFYPGPGLGGHCIPIDPFYLAWRAKLFNMRTRFVELAGEINTFMPRYVVERTKDALNSQFKSINGSKILILGISYKKNIDDVRESPALEIIKLLSELGANISFHDPFFEEFPKTRNYSFSIKNVDLNPEELEKYDAALLITDHDSFDYELINSHSKLLIDTRGKYPSDENVIKA